MIATLLSTLLVAAPAAATPARQSLIEAANAFDRAQIGKDRATMEAMILDDLVYIQGSGKRAGKTEFIAGWMGPGDRFDPITLIDRTVTMLGPNAGVVGAEVKLCGTSDGGRFCSNIRYADTFRKVAGRWRVADVQVTRMAP